MRREIRKCLQVFVEDTDCWKGEPLYEAIVRLLHKHGVAGATVWSGVMGYGAHGWIHRKGLFGVADEKPTGSNFFPPPWKTSRRTLTARRNPGLLSTSKSIFDELSWI